MSWIWVAVVAIVLLGPVRVALRLRAQMRASVVARKLGAVHCAHCGSEGPVYGYGTFFARGQVRCARCKRPIDATKA